MRSDIRTHIPWRTLRAALLLAIALPFCMAPALAHAEGNSPIEVPTLTVDVSYSGSGTVEPSGQIVVEPGGTQVIRITPDEGYVVGTVVRNGSTILFNPEGGQYALTSIMEHQVVTVTFVKAETEQPPEYPIEISCDTGGRISPASGLVQQGKPFTFVCEADEGYTIDTLTVDGAALPAGGQTVYTHTIDHVERPTKITASFRRTAYRITVTATEGGAVSPSGVTDIEIGESCSVTIVPDDGYRVKSVLANGKTAGIGVDGGVYHFSNVNRDCTLDIIFEPIPTPTPAPTPKPDDRNDGEDESDDADAETVAFTLFCTDGGKVMAESGTQMPAAFNVETGGEIRLFLVPDSGHRVAKLYVDGDDMGIQEYSGVLLFTDVQDGHRLVVQFEQTDEMNDGSTFEVAVTGDTFEYTSKEAAATPAPPDDTPEPDGTPAPEATPESDTEGEKDGSGIAQAMPIAGLIIFVLAAAGLVVLWAQGKLFQAKEPEEAPEDTDADQKTEEEPKDGQLEEKHK